MNIIQILKSKLMKINCLEDSLEVFYVAGSQSLPPPLEQAEEEELVKKLELNNDLQARQTLVERNLRLVVYIAKKFENTGVDLDDLVSIGTLGLIKAVNSFNSDKDIKLATFASRCIENEILMHLRKISKTKNDVSLEDPINIDSECNILMLEDVLSSEEETIIDKLQKETEEKMLEESFKKLTLKEQELIKLRFGVFGGEKKTQKEIADYFGISQSYISRLEKKIMDKLKYEMEKLM